MAHPLVGASDCSHAGAWERKSQPIDNALLYEYIDHIAVDTERII
jgi:hypothetical protein